MTASSRSATLARAILWRNLWLPGSEHAALWQTSDGWLLKGTVACATDDRRPMLAIYSVACDSIWRTRHVQVERIIGAESRGLTLESTEEREWKSSGKLIPSVSGCIDVDLSVSPITNTLSIRRLNLAVGESAAVNAAWVRFPELNIEMLSQTFCRVRTNSYDYQSSTGFRTEIEVDDLGLVVNYPPAWERVATSV